MNSRTSDHSNEYNSTYTLPMYFPGLTILYMTGFTYRPSIIIQFYAQRVLLR